MAYEPTEWKCGDNVTAELMNKLERGVAELTEYTPNTWECGDIITAEKLNRLEQAVADASSGGDCDFSTANVSIQYSGDPEIGYSIMWATIDYYDDEIYAWGDRGYTNVQRTIVLYKGHCKIAIDSMDDNYYYPANAISLSGDATMDEDEITVIITGDCVIALDSTQVEPI